MEFEIFIQIAEILNFAKNAQKSASERIFARFRNQITICSVIKLFLEFVPSFFHTL